MWGILTSLVRDLWSVLPGKSVEEWQELHSIVPDRPTVVLVSGFGATERTLSVLRKRLIRDQYNVVVLSLDLGSLADSISGFYRMAEKLSALLLRIRKESPLKNGSVFLVAHSVGGLVARRYVQQLGGSHYCDGLVTLATPHQGTWFALLGLLTHLILRFRCLLQMTPVSGFIREVNKASYPENFKMCSIYSRSDYMCPPRSTALPKRLKGMPDIQTFELNELAHSDFLMSKRAYLLLRSCLVQMDPDSLAKSA